MDGTTDGWSQKVVSFPAPVTARYIRVHPLDAFDKNGPITDTNLRVGVIKCQQGTYYIRFLTTIWLTRVCCVTSESTNRSLMLNFCCLKEKCLLDGLKQQNSLFFLRNQSSYICVWLFSLTNTLTKLSISEACHKTRINCQVGSWTSWSSCSCDPKNCEQTRDRKIIRFIIFTQYYIVYLFVDGYFLIKSIMSCCQDAITIISTQEHFFNILKRELQNF